MTELYVFFKIDHSDHFILQDFKTRIASHEMRLNEACQLGDAILTRCHPDAVTIIKHWITVLQARWEEVRQTS